MSASIQQALGQLFYRLEDLEALVAVQEQKAKARQAAGVQPQADLFGKKAAGRKLDPAAVSKKLDSTIEKVEQILKEG